MQEKKNSKGKTNRVRCHRESEEKKGKGRIGQIMTFYQGSKHLQLYWAGSG